MDWKLTLFNEICACWACGWRMLRVVGKKRAKSKKKKHEESELVAEGQRQTQVVLMKKERHGKCKRETTELSGIRKKKSLDGNQENRSDRDQ